MKKISIVIPTYNEEENIKLLIDKLISIFSEKLSNYNYEFIVIDNFSTDGTREKLREIANSNKKIKVILNAKNFGQLNSPFYGILQSTGDCTVLMVADFQDPPEMLVDFVHEWEKGNKIVIGIKNKSKESKIMYVLRTMYYKIIKKISNIEHIEHFTGFGLYDKEFIAVLKTLRDPLPYLRGIVVELGFQRKELMYEQPKRELGKTKNNFYSLYDIGMLGITSYTKVVLRLATLIGFATGLVSFFVAFLYLILKLIFWNMFPAGTVPILIGIFFLGGTQLFFIGFLGEYIMSINNRIMDRPLVIEEERLNFEKDSF